MLNTKRLALFIYFLLLGACTVTGPADDGYDNSNEWVDNGHLLSNDTKTLYNSVQSQSAAVLKPDQSNALALDEKTEFEQFKLWQKLRAAGTDSAQYQEFLEWLKFQEFKSTQ
jgi:hypothetical protein